MNPVILFRGNRDVEDEFFSASKFFTVVRSRTLCKDNLVVPRYSALPFYRELEDDLKHNNCRLINSYSQHRWIANFEYYQSLAEFTPQTWTSEEFPLSEYPGPFVVKGRTNSKKGRWSTLMFAKDRDSARRIASELLQDSFISEQDVIFRKYIPLRTFEYGIGGMPFSNEWRFFFLGNQLLSYGYYWSIAEDLTSPKVSEEGISLAKTVASIAANYVNFFVVDIAETAEGEWILIELNDGSMSGLSENVPDEMYGNLASALSVWK